LIFEVWNRVFNGSKPRRGLPQSELEVCLKVFSGHKTLGEAVKPLHQGA